jgi:hypothetical protein
VTLKLEFFDDGLDGGPLILLYGGGRDEVALLQEAVRVLAEGVGRQLAIHELPFVQSVDACRLSAISAEADVGVVATSTFGAFEWTLTPESWLQTDELLEPFCEERSAAAFQYLNPAPGPEVIYSTDRAW